VWLFAFDASGTFTPVADAYNSTIEEMMFPDTFELSTLITTH